MVAEKFQDIGWQGSRFWEEILVELKNRGVKHVEVFVVDGLTGLKEVIKRQFPKSLIQECILHAIRKYNKQSSEKRQRRDSGRFKESIQSRDNREGEREYGEILWTGLTPYFWTNPLF